MCVTSLYGAKMGHCRAGRAARKRRHRQESTIQSGINLFFFHAAVIVPSFLTFSLCFFSLSVSPAAVCEVDEVSSPAGIQLNAAAASGLHWYDQNYRHDMLSDWKHKHHFPYLKTACVLRYMIKYEFECLVIDICSSLWKSDSSATIKICVLLLLVIQTQAEGCRFSEM